MDWSWNMRRVWKRTHNVYDEPYCFSLNLLYEWKSISSTISYYFLACLGIYFFCSEFVLYGFVRDHNSVVIK